MRSATTLGLHARSLRLHSDYMRGQDAIRTRSKRGQDEISTRSKRGQDEISTRSKRGQDEITLRWEAKAGRDQTEITATSGRTARRVENKLCPQSRYALPFFSSPWLSASTKAFILIYISFKPSAFHFPGPWQPSSKSNDSDCRQ